MPQNAETEKRIRELEEAISSLEEINRVLMERVERSIDSAGSAFSLFETNILLQQRIGQRTEELERSNLKLRAEIAERKQAEQALRDSEERSRTLLNCVLTGILVIDAENHIIVDVNPLAAEMIGVPKEKIVGSVCHNFVCPAEKGRCPITDLGQTVDASERVCLTADGRRIQILKTVVPIIMNGREHLVESFIDISERKRAEQELRESRTRFQDIALSTSDWLWEVDAKGTYTFCSEKVENVLGYTTQEIIGKTPFDLMPPEEAERIRYRFQEIAAAKASIIDLENWNLHKDGHLVCLLTNGIPVLDVQGNLIGYRGADKDITERMRVEAEKAKLETQLRQSQKMEAIGTLAGGIAHDFNNILMAMLGCADMAMYDIPRDSMAYANLQEVLKAGLRAKDLVLQILTFSRQMEQERQLVAVAPVIKETLRLLRASLPTTIEIRQNIASDCGAVLADPTQVQQVIMNLCTNAFHAMREQGGVLEVNAGVVEVDTEFAWSRPNLNKGPHIRITVSDTGHGMDRVTQERIFEPFFTTKPIGEGTGMGLATVHGIVTSHCGAISVYSEVGKGTTFQVYLPQIRSTAPLEASEAEPVVRGKESILFVDDEVSLVRIGRQMLERLGYKVTVRTSSVEALELFRARPESFDLVITDMTMPNMTGVELAEELMRIRPDIPLILVTGFSEAVTPEKAKEMGIREFIMKPVISRDLSKVIRQVLDQEEKEELEPSLAFSS